MALPKRKHSKSRRDKRRNSTCYQMTAVSLSICPHCKQRKMPHRICPKCGYYNGKPVIMIKEKEKTKKK